MNIKKCVDEDGQKVLNFTMLTLHLTAFFIVGIDAIVIVVSSFFLKFPRPCIWLFVLNDF